jgi:hypothetical protein
VTTSSPETSELAFAYRVNVRVGRPIYSRFWRRTPWFIDRLDHAGRLTNHRIRSALLNRYTLGHAPAVNPGCNTRRTDSSLLCSAGDECGELSVRADVPLVQRAERRRGQQQ